MSRCAHPAPERIAHAGQDSHYWCTSCGALGKGGIWRHSDLGLLQCTHPDRHQEVYGPTRFCELCNETWRPGNAGGVSTSDAPC